MRALRRAVAQHTPAAVACAAHAAAPTQRRAQSSSFVGALYRGNIKPVELFPYPPATAPESACVDDDVVNDVVKAGATPESEVWGLALPQVYGGSEAAHVALCQIAAEVTERNPNAYMDAHPHAFLASYLVRSFASKEQKGRYLTELSDGKATIGWAPRDAGQADLARVACKAVRDDTTATFKVTGTKYVSLPKTAAPLKFALILARIEYVDATAPEGLTWLFVEMGTPGVTLEGNILTLNNASIPVDSNLSDIGGGYRMYMTTALTAPYVLAGAAVGVMRRAVPHIASAAAAQRLAARAYALESVAAALAANIDASVADTFQESALTSAFTRDCTQAVIDAALEHNLPASVVDEALAIEAQYGNVDADTDAAACCGMEDAAVLFNNTGTFETMRRRQLRAMGTVDRLPEGVSADEAIIKQFESVVASFGTAIERTTVRQGSLIAQQDILPRRCAAVALDLFSTAAVMSRSQRALASKQPTAPVEHALAMLWAHSAVARAEQNTWEIQHAAQTADDSHGRLAAEVLASVKKPKAADATAKA